VPELPEVEVVRHGLAPAVTDARIVSVDVSTSVPSPGIRWPQPTSSAVWKGAMCGALPGPGKFLWLPLADTAAEPEALVAHLGMSGQMLLRDPDAPLERHERVRMRIEHPRHGMLAVVFADQRTFGSLAVDRLLPTPDAAPGGYGTADPLVPSQVAHIARDPLDPAFDERGVIDRVRRRSSAIKRILLDQSLVSGIGNIYADESLWAARIHPETHGTALSVQALRRLFAEVRLVLERALAEGGTSFDAQYVNVNGQAGYFAHSLNAYGRGGQACPRCGGPIRREAFMNRSSHYCPRCQRRR